MPTQTSNHIGYSRIGEMVIIIGSCLVVLGSIPGFAYTYTYIYISFEPKWNQRACHLMVG